MMLTIHLRLFSFIFLNLNLVSFAQLDNVSNNPNRPYYQNLNYPTYDVQNFENVEQQFTGIKGSKVSQVSQYILNVSMIESPKRESIKKISIEVEQMKTFHKPLNLHDNMQDTKEAEKDVIEVNEIDNVEVKMWNQVSLKRIDEIDTNFTVHKNIEIKEANYEINDDDRSSSDGEEQQILPTTVTMRVNWEKKGQQMEGFGVFAGREAPFAQSKFRDKIMERLFSFDGLGLTIFRGQLYPNLNYLTNSFPPNETRAGAQLVLFKEAKTKYNVDKFVLSSWSPPYNWKTLKGVPFGRVGSSINRLTHTHFDKFAKYIINYIEFCKLNGIDIYSISPQNEPEFPTTSWEGCVWWPTHLGDFLNYLRPLMEAKGLDVKIMVGETGNWKTADFYLFLMRLFMKDPDRQVDIVASHGYSLPKIGDLLVTYETSPRPWILSYNFKKPRWITEASCTMNYDGSMNTGIKLATSLHHFIANNNVSAYIYWLAMLDHESNEALIFEDKNNDKLIYPKVYYIFGQFTKWIRPGYIRIDLKKKFFEYDSTGTLASIYLNEKTNDFVLVVINPHKSKKSTFKLDFNGAQIENEMNLVGYQTNNDVNWEPMAADEFILENNSSHLTLINNPLSIKTIAGRFVFDNIKLN